MHMGQFKGGSRFLILQLLQLLLLGASARALDTAASETYVVYMGRSSPTGISTTGMDRLTTVFESQAAASNSMVYSYSNFNAFAAKLTPAQAATLRDQEGVVSVFPNRAKRLHTTHSWAFLGLEDGMGNVPMESLWKKSNYGDDVIIGVLDTGVWPESASFDDTGLGPIPARWNGKCEKGDQFGPKNCNKKLIGGRYFIKGFEAAEGPLNTTETGDFLSARDQDGHGSHTMSTAGGSFAPGANLLGFAPGTAKGGAPRARVAMYKVCWPSTSESGGCYDADILKAFDQGIDDGVDVFSVSLGTDPPLPPFFRDGLAIGAFHAAQRNISVVCSAGNAGPDPGTVANVAPWMTTVAASSIDRSFPSKATLGNNVVLTGSSIGSEKLPDTFFPLVSSARVFLASSNSTASELCVPGSLDPAKVTGKIVACLRGVTARVSKGRVVKDAGGIGMILSNDVLSGNERLADPHVLPATAVIYEDGLKLFSYINLTTNPVAKISAATTLLGDKPAPVLTSFSSAGPNTLIPDLLKPDITGPGLDILAAYTQAQSITNSPEDNRISPFNIISGTSMSCPHVAGVTAALKAYHPEWSPAALRSAIVTTGSLYDNTKGRVLNSSLTPATAFNFGGGHLAPNSAAEPGLVYDSDAEDYVTFLCSLGYTETEVKAIVGKRHTCPLIPPSVSDFNYPSVSVSNLTDQAVVKRSVTNVGTASATYQVEIESPPGIRISVSPTTLEFSSLGQKLTFSITITKLNGASADYSFGSYTWKDGVHSVRSPLVVNTA